MVAALKKVLFPTLALPTIPAIKTLHFRNQLMPEMKLKSVLRLGVSLNA